MAIVQRLQAILSVDTDGYKRGLQQAHESTGSFMSNVVGAGKGVLEFGSKLGLGVIGVKALADSAIGLGSALLSPVAAMEQNKIAFTGLLGSAQKADAFLRDMQGFAASTPFEFPQLVTASQHMLAFGFSADKIKPMLTAIGDGMAGMGQGGEAVDRVVTIFGQMHAATKVTAGDMMQLTSMGIPAWQMLADKMGLSVPKLQEMVSKGLVPADKAIGILTDGMENKFPKAMDKQSVSFNGLMSTLNDNIGLAMQAFAGPLFERAKGALEKLGALVSSPGFQQFAAVVGGAVVGALDTLVNILGTLYNAGQAAFGFFAGNQVALDALVAVVGSITAAIGVWAVATVVALVPAFIAWAAAAGAAAIATIAATWPILAVIAAVAALAFGIMMLVQHWSDVQAFFANIGAAIMAFLANVGQWFAGIGAAILGAITGAFESVKTFIMNAINGWLIIFRWLYEHNHAFKFLVDLVITTMNNIKAVITTVWNAITGFFSVVWNAIKATVERNINAVRAVVTAVFGFISGFISDQWNKMVRGAQIAWGLLVGAISGVVGRVVSAVQGVIRAIMDPILNLGSRLFEAAKAAIQRFIDGIKSMAGNVARAIANALGFHGLPGFASGGVAPGGLAVVGEHGPEIVALPAGARVYPHGQSPFAAGASSASGISAGGGTTVINLVLDDVGQRTLARVLLPHQVEFIRAQTGTRR